MWTVLDADGHESHGRTPFTLHTSSHAYHSRIDSARKHDLFCGENGVQQQGSVFFTQQQEVELLEMLPVVCEKLCGVLKFDGSAAWVDRPGVSTHPTMLWAGGLRNARATNTVSAAAVRKYRSNTKPRSPSQLPEAEREDPRLSA